MQIYKLFLNFASYNKKKCWNIYFNTYFINVVQEGIEPPTFALWVHYSNRWVTRPNRTCTRNRTLTKSLEEICAICYTIQAFCTDNRIRAYNLVLMRDLFFHLNYIGIKKGFFSLFNLPGRPQKTLMVTLLVFKQNWCYSIPPKAKVLI